LGQLGVGLIGAVYAVTLYSDRTPEAILNGKPVVPQCTATRT